MTNPKFAQEREGPFKITEVLSLITYRLQLPKVWNIHPVFHASLLPPYCENPVHGPNFPAPPPDLIAREEEYEIEQILRHRGPPNCRSFLIRRKGYLAKEDSWVPEKELTHATDILYKYKILHPTVFPPRTLKPPTISKITMSFCACNTPSPSPSLPRPQTSTISSTFSTHTVLDSLPTPSSPSSIQFTESRTSSPSSTEANPGWGSPPPVQTTSLRPVHPVEAVDLPLYAHRLRNDFPSDTELDHVTLYLRDSRMAIPIAAHLDMGSPLYALYRTYLSVSNISNVVPGIIGRVPSLFPTQLRTLQQTTQANLGIAMYQLGMLEFLDDLDCYLRENAAATGNPIPLIGNFPHSPTTGPSASSSTVDENERRILDLTEVQHDRTLGHLPLPPSHPDYSKACYQCHRLTHLRKDCAVYQCPTCLRWAPGHSQGRCPLHHTSQPPRTSSSSSSGSNQSRRPVPVPPPRGPRGRGRRTTTRITPYHPPRHLIASFLDRNNYGLPNPSDEDYFVSSDAEANMTGSPGLAYRDF